MDDDLYWNIGTALGGITALIVFVGGWWYCAATYGFLFGFGLGWLPSGIAAAMAFFAVKLLWGPMALLAVLLGYLSYSNNQKNRDILAASAESEGSPATTPTLERKAPSAWIGRYAGNFGGTATGIVEITPASKNRNNISISVKSKSCTGKIEGSIDFANNPASFGTYDPNKGVLCFLKVSNMNNYLEISEENCGSLHGFTCSFDGRAHIDRNSSAN
jgi:hypothetical protein